MNGRDRPTGRARTVFFGSGGFGVPILEAISTAPEVELVAVVSAPDRPAGRHGRLTASPVAVRARELGLHLLQPQRVRAPESVAELRRLELALGVLADYGQLVPQAILDLPVDGILNLHPSLVPRHRGATPVPAAILAGDDATGVTLMRLDAGLDTGPVLATESLALDGSETAPELEARLAVLGATLLRRSLAAWLAGRLVERPQPETGTTLTRLLRREDGLLDPLRPATALARQVRAYLPWPGSYLETPEGRLVVWAARAEEGSAGPPGRLVAAPGSSGLSLTTIDGRLRLLELQLAGRRRVTAEELLRGHPEFAESGIGSE